MVDLKRDDGGTGGEAGSSTVMSVSERSVSSHWCSIVTVVFPEQQKEKNVTTAAYGV